MEILPTVEHQHGGYPNMEKSLTSRASQERLLLPVDWLMFLWFAIFVFDRPVRVFITLLLYLYLF